MHGEGVTHLALPVAFRFRDPSQSPRWKPPKNQHTVKTVTEGAIMGEPANRKHGVGYWCYWGVCWAVFALVLYVATYSLILRTEQIQFSYAGGGPNATLVRARLPRFSENIDTQRRLRQFFKPILLLDVKIRRSFWMTEERFTPSLDLYGSPDADYSHAVRGKF